MANKGHCLVRQPSDLQLPNGHSYFQTFMDYFELTRLHKFPLGNILVIWPCVWGLAMAAYKMEAPLNELVFQSAVFVFGATLLHSTACVINDICDVDFDRQVERTKNRPLASGRISMRGAWILLFAMTAGCYFVLSFANPIAAFVGAFGIFPFHALYPLMKRWTWWPQAWLGIAMNWGFLVAWLSIKPICTVQDLWILGTMFSGTVCWTLVYDTQYACQDRKDDLRAGVKSTALLFGTYVRQVLAFFASVFLISMVMAGYYNSHTVAYYVIACGGAALHFVWQLYTWQVDEPADCGRKFKSNGDIGYIIWFGVLVDYGYKMRYI